LTLEQTPHWHHHFGYVSISTDVFSSLVQLRQKFHCMR